jgi:hypothetical protein
MSNSHILLRMAAFILLLGASDAWAEDHPQLVPARDVDLNYNVTRPGRERVRWLARDQLECVDVSGQATTIFDRNRHEVTLVVPYNHTYRKLEGGHRRLLEPGSDAAVERGNSTCRRTYAPIGLGPRTAKHTLFAPPPTASFCV